MKEWNEDRLTKVRDLIHRLYAVVRELEHEFEDRKFTPDGHLVGSIGEVVAAYAFGLKLLPASTETHDAEAPDGTLVQVKLTGGNRGVSLYGEPKHVIVLQLSGGEFKTVYNGPGHVVWKNCLAVQKNGQRSISLSVLRKLDASASHRLAQLREFPSLTGRVPRAEV